MYLELKEFYGLWKVKLAHFSLVWETLFLRHEQWTTKKSNKIVLIGKNLDHQTITINFHVDLVQLRIHNRVKSIFENNY